MMDKKTLCDLYREKSKLSPRGASCVAFIPVDEKWGMKCYTSKQTRDNFLTRQAAAAEHGLAPEVGEKFYLVSGEHKIYGFLTEIVEAAREGFDIDEEGYDELERMEESPIYNEQINDLRRNLKNKINFSFLDCHGGNVGVKNGKLVCIDFGG